MAYFPQNADTAYAVENVTPYLQQGAEAVIGGGFTTISGQPSNQLLPSSNTILGYFVGQMLAKASGVKSDASPSGLTAGALINFDPASLDTGQKVWIGMIIIDQGLKQPLPIGTTYYGNLKASLPGTNWVILQQFLYASGTPATDISIVNTAVQNFGVFQYPVPTQNLETQIAFIYK